LNVAFDDHPEAAWMFRGEAHGQGFALEAMTAAAQWLDAKLRPEKMVCIIDPQNAGSLRLAGKLGFEPFGTAFYRNARVTMLGRRRGISPCLLAPPDGER
jgi:RimJ/RimL family protein N-acetyltransferase